MNKKNSVDASKAKVVAPADSSRTEARSSLSKSPAPEKKSATQAPARDVVWIHGMTEDKKGLKVLRARDDSLEAGEVRPLAEGQPITSDVVRLKPRQGTPFVCDVETEVSMDELRQRTAPARSGPAQVASAAYRQNWDQIWSKSERSETDPSKLN